MKNVTNSTSTEFHKVFNPIKLTTSIAICMGGSTSDAIATNLFLKSRRSYGKNNDIVCDRANEFLLAGTGHDYTAIHCIMNNYAEVLDSCNQELAFSLNRIHSMINTEETILNSVILTLRDYHQRQILAHDNSIKTQENGKFTLGDSSTALTVSSIFTFMVPILAANFKHMAPAPGSGEYVEAELFTIFNMIFDRVDGLVGFGTKDKLEKIAANHATNIYGDIKDSLDDLIPECVYVAEAYQRAIVNTSIKWHSGRSPFTYLFQTIRNGFTVRTATKK